VWEGDLQVEWFQRNRVLVGTLFVGLLLRLVYAGGMSSADDLAMASAAQKLLEDGLYLPAGHYDARLAMVYPLAGVFSVFGQGEWQLALLPLLASMLTLFLTYKIGELLVSKSVGLVAVAVLALFPLDVYYATRFVPDSYFSAFMTAAIYLSLKAYRHDHAPSRLGLLAGMIWGLGYLVKIEAAFLLIPLLYLAWQNRHVWQTSFAIALGCFLFVCGENFIYFLQTGELLYRVAAIGATSSIDWNPEYAATQLWVFPKAWFLTPYLFGAHYYLLFAGAAWFHWHRDNRFHLPLLWAGVFLLWLQFGFNPFELTPSFKSHLARYCINLSAPAALIVAGFVVALHGRWRTPVKIAGCAVGLGSLFLMQFNLLSSEREEASKVLLAQMDMAEKTPVYMDSGSLTIAAFLYQGTPASQGFNALQQHDYKTGDTKVVPLETMDGYLLLNQGFVEHRKNRYFMDGVSVRSADLACRRLLEVENPSPALSYYTARFIKSALSLFPVAAIREKATATAQKALAGDDAVLYDCRTAS
jgi:hypothetical protein